MPRGVTQPPRDGPRWEGHPAGVLGELGSPAGCQTARGKISQAEAPGHPPSSLIIRRPTVLHGTSPTTCSPRQLPLHQESGRCAGRGGARRHPPRATGWKRKLPAIPLGPPADTRRSPLPTKGAPGEEGRAGQETERLCLPRRDSQPVPSPPRSPPPRSSRTPWVPGAQGVFSPPRVFPHSRCTRGPARGTAALVRTALRSPPLPYSAQHDWSGGVSGPGEDERRGSRRRRRHPDPARSFSSQPATETRGPERGRAQAARLGRPRAPLRSLPSRVGSRPPHDANTGLATRC